MSTRKGATWRLWALAGGMILPAMARASDLPVLDDGPLPESPAYERGVVAPQVRLPITLEVLGDREIDTDRVFLGAIAKCEGHASICEDMTNVDLGAAPAPGRLLSITQASIGDIVRQEYENIDLTVKGRDIVQLRGASQDIDQETMQREFRAFIASRYLGRHDLRVRVDRVTMTSTMKIRPGGYRVEFPGFVTRGEETTDQIIKRCTGFQTIEASIVPENANDRAPQTVWINAAMVVERELPVARANLMPRATVGASDVEMAWVSVGRGVIQYAESVSVVEGRRLRGSVMVGQPIPASQLETPQAVRVGSMVRVMVRDGDLEVVGRAKAAGSGAVGQVIDVVYPATQKRVSVRITGNDAVEAVF